MIRQKRQSLTLTGCKLVAGVGVPEPGGYGADVEHGADVERRLADLARWMADERAREAAGERSRERWLRQAATESARLSGLALDLAERGRAVAIRTTAGRGVRGALVAVADDFWVVDGPAGTTFLLLAAVATVRAAPTGAPLTEATGDRMDV